MSTRMNRAVVCVATGSYRRGATRLRERVAQLDPGVGMLFFDDVPPNTPSHKTVPYAFKATALREAADMGFTTLLWADACIWPTRSLAGLFKRIEKDGYWISANGWINAQWTAESAYDALGLTPEENARIPHVVATAFGLSLEHPRGRAIFGEYVRLGTETNAFCGPWKNGPKSYDGRTAPCGGAEVLGHRHDQTALSVIAWRNDCVLTKPPAIFAYGTADGEHDPETVLVAEGGY